MQRLHTARLLLEPQLATHAPAMFEVLRDPAIYQYEDQPPESLDWLRQRFERLALRVSADGRQQWLNWVLRRHMDQQLIGYVQATVQPDGHALLAYVLASPHWGQGLAGEAVRAMLAELQARWRVHTALAVLKAANQRSLGLLLRLGFVRADPTGRAGLLVEADECLMRRALGPPPH